MNWAFRRPIEMVKCFSSVNFWAFIQYFQASGPGRYKSKVYQMKQSAFLVRNFTLLRIFNENLRPQIQFITSKLKVIYLQGNSMDGKFGIISESSFFFQWLLQQRGYPYLVPMAYPPVLPEKRVYDHITDAPSPIFVKYEETVAKNQAQNFSSSSPKKNKDQNYNVKAPDRRERNARRQRNSNNDKSFNPKAQKKNRNVLSNLVHHLLKFLGNKSNTEKLVHKIIECHNLNLDPKECFALFQVMQQSLKSYVTQKCLKNIWFGNFESELGFKITGKEKELAKLIRVVCSKFYHSHCFQSVLLSSKLSLESKGLHYKGIRDMRYLLRALTIISPETSNKNI